MSNGIDFTVGFSRSTDARARGSGESYDILVIGDFGGRRADRGLAPQRVTIESFDTVLRRIAPIFPAAELELQSLDDLHPDRLGPQLPPVAQLLELRRRLVDPATHRAAAAELLAGSPGRGEEPAGEPDSKPAADSADGRSLFDNLIAADRAVGTDTHESRAASRRVDSLIRDLIAPHIEPGVGDDLAQLLAIVDDSIGSALRRILHDPDFQRLEASWRGLHWLAQSLEIDDTLRIYVIDAPLAAVSADLAPASGSPHDSELYRRVVEDRLETPGARVFNLIVADYGFGATKNDLGTLASLASLAARAGCALVAEAEPTLFGCESLASQPHPGDWRVDDDLAESWRELRSSPNAPYVGLAAPRLLLRLPYGAKGEPVDVCAFDELAPRPGHEQFLWGNPAYGCAILAGRAFLEEDHATIAGTYLPLESMPLAIYDDGGGQAIKPAAEAYLGETTADALGSRGLMCFLSQRNADSVSLLRFQSIADPPTRLRGI